jgi:PKHD-type hydroxylase
MNLKNSYYWFKEAISPEDCQRIVDRGLAQLEINKQQGLDTGGVTSGGMEKQSKTNAISLEDKTVQEFALEKNVSVVAAKEMTYVRDSEVAWLADKWIFDLITPYIHSANEQAGWKFDIDGSEFFQFTVYKPGGFYGWHVDGCSDHSNKLKRFIPGITPLDKTGKTPLSHTRNPNHVGKIRKLSMTLNLNAPNDYEGGVLNFDFGPQETKRYHECTEIAPQGSLIVFPSFIYHQVTPVTQGTRYSLVLWALGPPFK